MLKLISILILVLVTSNVSAKIITCPVSDTSSINGKEWDLKLEKLTCNTDPASKNNCENQFFKYNRDTKKIDGYSSPTDESEVKSIRLNTTSNQVELKGMESILECSGTYLSLEKVPAILWGYKDNLPERGKFVAELYINQKCIVSENISFQCDEE